MRIEEVEEKGKRPGESGGVREMDSKKVEKVVKSFRTSRGEEKNLE